MKHNLNLMVKVIGVYFLQSCLTVTVFAETRWYDFNMKDLSKEYHSLLEMVLDPPAGKHGYLKISNGNLLFDNGTPARFWGVNITSSSCFPTYEMAEKIATDLARLGFNNVRFHHIDTGFEPKGIFKDTAPKKKNLDAKKTGIFSESQLDKLDYFILQLKKKGIYVNLNLLSGRKFTAADGVKGAKELRDYTNQAGKPASLFNEHLIRLQEDYINALLNHFNPYTKMRYKDDPAIAFLEIANENSLFRYWISGLLDGSTSGKRQLPVIYEKELDALWEKWHKKNEANENISPPRPPFKNRKAYTVEEVNNVIVFYERIEAKFFNRIYNFIKRTIGSRALVTASGSYYSTANIRAQSVTDFTSPHYYWDQPVWLPNKKWDKRKFEITNASLFETGKGVLRKKANAVTDIAMSHVEGKPLLITEWNTFFPNRYAYELPIILSTYGSLHDWDGANIFGYLNADAKRLKEKIWWMISRKFGQTHKSSY